jgi:uncharacterized protein (UPF0210 family)
MDIMLAKSKAGHDKNHIYVVLQQTNDVVYLVNGVTKTVGNPKKKKRIHIQPIKHLPEEILSLVENAEALDDATAVRILDLYNRRK